MSQSVQPAETGFQPQPMSQREDACVRKMRGESAWSLAEISLPACTQMRISFPANNNKVWECGLKTHKSSGGSGA